MYQGNTWLVLNEFEMFDEEYAGKGPMHTKEEQVLARNLNDEQGTCTNGALGREEHTNQIQNKMCNKYESKEKKKDTLR